MSSSKPVVKKTSKTASPVSVPVPASVPVEPKSKSSSRSVSPVVPVAPLVPVVEAVAPVVESSLQEELKSLHERLTSIRDSATQALASLKRLGRKAVQEVKDAGKRKKGRKAPEDGEVRKLSNFEIPVGISDELSAFFGGGKGALMSRAEVNKRMFAYAKDNFLTEGQVIHLESTPELLAKGFKPSAAVVLRKLLALPEGEKLTIFNIQKHMGRHYTKVTTA
jgi:hypothetical protein